MLEPPHAGEVVIAGVVDIEPGAEVRIARVRQVRRVRAGERLVAPTAGDQTFVVAWHLDPAVFVDPLGQPLDDAVYDGLNLRAVADRPEEPAAAGRLAGSCRRCLAPAFARGPQIVHAGSSCPPPGVGVTLQAVAGRLTEEVRQALLDEVRLEWPGPCACEATPVSLEPQDIALTPAETSTTLPHRAYAELPSGEIGLFDDQEVVLVRGGAGIAVRGTVPPDTEEPGIVTAALSLGDELLVAKLEGRPRMFKLHWWSAASGLAAWSPIGGLTREGFALGAAAAVREIPGQFLIAGRVRSIGPHPLQVLACRRTGATCAMAVGLAGNDDTDTFSQAHRLEEDGGWLFTSQTGTLLHLARAPAVDDVLASPSQGGPERARAQPGALVQDGVVGRATTRWRSMLLQEVAVEGVDFMPFAALRSATVIGDRAYLCAAVRAGPTIGKNVILSRRFGAADLDAPDPLLPNLGFRVEACLPPSGTCHLVRTGSIAWAFLQDGTKVSALRFDRDGPLDPERLRTPRCEASTLSVASPYPAFARRVQLTPDVWLGVGAGGEVARVDAAGLRWIYGLPGRPSWSSVVADDDGGSWYFGPPGVIGHARPGSSRVVPMAAPALTSTVWRAALDRSAPPGHRAFLAITELPLTHLYSQLTRVDVDLGAGAVAVRPLPRGGPLYPSDVVEVRPGVHVVIAGNLEAREVREEIWRVEGDRVDPRPVEADDPGTSEVESPLPSSEEHCAKPRRPSDLSRASVGRRLDSLRALSASHGVAWAVGCGGQMHRITAVTSTVRVERHAFERYPGMRFPLGPEGDLGVYGFTAVTALCPDHAVLAADETTTNALGVSARVMELGPESGAGRTRADADVRLTVVGSEAVVGLNDKGFVMDVLPRRGSPLLVLGTDDPRRIPGTVAELAGGRAAFYGAVPTAGARLSDGRLVVTFEGGLVLTAPAPTP